jgi:hypothetical protein
MRKRTKGYVGLAALGLTALCAWQVHAWAGDVSGFPDGYDAVQAAPGSHKVIFENALVRVLEVTIPPNGQTEPMHHHRWPSLLHVHGVVFSAWVSLFLVQTLLIERGSRRLLADPPKNPSWLLGRARADRSGSGRASDGGNLDTLDQLFAGAAADGRVTQTPSRVRGRCESQEPSGYCGLREAEVDAVPATSSEVPLLECSASTVPTPFVARAPLSVVAFTPRAPVRLAD